MLTIEISVKDVELRHNSLTGNTTIIQAFPLVCWDYSIGIDINASISMGYSVATDVVKMQTSNRSILATQCTTTWWICQQAVTDYS